MASKPRQLHLYDRSFLSSENLFGLSIEILITTCGEIISIPAIALFRAFELPPCRGKPHAIRWLQVGYAQVDDSCLVKSGWRDLIPRPLASVSSSDCVTRTSERSSCRCRPAARRCRNRQSTDRRRLRPTGCPGRCCWEVVFTGVTLQEVFVRTALGVIVVRAADELIVVGSAEQAVVATFSPGSRSTVSVKCNGK